MLSSSRSQMVASTTFPPRAGALRESRGIVSVPPQYQAEDDFSRLTGSREATAR